MIAAGAFANVALLALPAARHAQHSTRSVSASTHPNEVSFEMRPRPDTILLPLARFQRG